MLYDLKEIDPENHKRFTGITNKGILHNLIMLGNFMKDRGMPGDLWIRTPLIPGCTATPENIKGIGAFIKKQLHSVVSRWDLCTFNNLCTHKYDGWGSTGALKGQGSLMRIRLITWLPLPGPRVSIRELFT